MFNERLLKMRKNAYLTQEELAKKINVSKQSVGSWERGRTEPSIETITELANVLNTTTDYLLGRTTIQNEQQLLNFSSTVGEIVDNEDINIYEFLSNINNLDTHSLQIIISLVDRMVTLEKRQP